MKGVPYLGGSLGFSSQTSSMKPASGSEVDGPKTTSWNFSPEFGYFISDHFSVGLGLNIAGSTTTQENLTPSITKRTQKSMTTGFMVNGRYYFQMNETFHIFTGLDVNVNPGKMETTDDLVGGTKDKWTGDMMGFGVDANLGIAWNVTEKILIFGKYGFLGWNSNTTKNDDNGTKWDDKNSSFGLNVNTYGSPFNVGMYFLLK